MKGVVLGDLPGRDARRHHPRHRRRTTSSAARSSWPRPIATFRPAPIFLVVVDPGVGSARRGDRRRGGRLPVRGAGQRRADPRARRSASRRKIVELTERRYARPTVSRTFEGRDRFAPAAAWLAKGVDLTALGRPAGAVQRLDVPQPRWPIDALDGEVLRVDRFGNLITNIDRRDVREVRGRRRAGDSHRRSSGVARGVDVCRRRRRRARARCSAAPTISRSPLNGGERRRGAARGHARAARRCTSRAVA